MAVGLRACGHPPHRVPGRGSAGHGAGAGAARPRSVGPHLPGLCAPAARAAVSRQPDFSGRRCRRPRCFEGCHPGSLRIAGGHPARGECTSTERQLDAPSPHSRETVLMPNLWMGKLRAKGWGYHYKGHFEALLSLFLEPSAPPLPLLGDATSKPTHQANQNTVSAGPGIGGKVRPCLSWANESLPWCFAHCCQGSERSSQWVFLAHWLRALPSSPTLGYGQSQATLVHIPTRLCDPVSQNPTPRPSVSPSTSKNSNNGNDNNNSW